MEVKVGSYYRKKVQIAWGWYAPVGDKVSILIKTPRTVTIEGGRKMSLRDFEADYGPDVGEAEALLLRRQAKAMGILNLERWVAETLNEIQCVSIIQLQENIDVAQRELKEIALVIKGGSC